MTSLTVAQCEDYLRTEIKRVDNLPVNERNNPQFYKRNALFYTWLVQREEIAITWQKLALLIGASSPDELRNLTELYSFYEVHTDVALRLIPEMEAAIENVFNQPELYYLITKPVPYFDGSLLGNTLIKYLNLLEKPEGMSLVEIVRNAVTNALPGIQIRVIDPDAPYVRLVSEQNNSWHFLLAVFPHLGVLYEDQVRELTSDLGLLRERLIDQGYGNLEVLLMTSGIDERAKRRIGKSPHLHHLWSLSTLRFFHLLNKSVKKFENSRFLVAEKFDAIFQTEAPAVTFSIRDAMDRLEIAVAEALKKKNT